VAEGVAHAPDVTLTAAASAPTATRTAQSAARCTAAKSRTRKDIDQPIGSQPHSRRRVFCLRAARPEAGPQVPSLWSPSLLAPQLGIEAASEWGEVCEGLRSFNPDLFTGLAESDRERPAIRSDPDL
jgi:hypothetical protein